VNSTGGAAGAMVTMDGIMFQILVDSCEEISRIRNSPIMCQEGQVIPGVLRERMPPWQRGQIVNAAAYIDELDQGKWNIPDVALDVSRQILAAEAAYLDELQAASLAGIPWKKTFGARFESCMRCGDAASWHFVLKTPPNMPVETGWRLTRPENAVPLCRRCTHLTDFEKREDIRLDLAWGLWAHRFEALHRWFLAVQYNWLPRRWSKIEYPLWPLEFGGSDWKDGSGSYINCLPHPPRGVKRLSVHYAALNRAMGVKTKRRGEIGPYFSALQLRRVIPDPKLEPGEFYCERGCVSRSTGTCGDCSRSRDSHTE
jgi:hypothetical protein